MYESENVQEITLLDIVTSLLKKWKSIICVTLAGLLIGSALGLTLTLLGNRFYGARTEFFVSSTATNSYILSMLKSDSYAEALLMDENGLPAEYAGTDLYNEAKAAREKVVELKKQIKEAEESLEPMEFEISKLSKAYSESQTAYNEALALLEMYKKADGEALSAAGPEAIANHYAVLATYEKDLTNRRSAKETARAAYNAALEKKQSVEQSVLVLNRELKDVVKEQDELFTKMHRQFMAVPENSEKIEKIKKYVSVGFVDETSAETEKTASNAVIYVDIAVPSDPEAATFLLENVSYKTLNFIENNIDDEEASFKYLTSFASADKIEVYEPVKTVLQYAIIFAVGAAVVYCFVFVVAVMIKPPKKAEEKLPESVEE